MPPEIKTKLLNGPFISLVQAAEVTPYTAEYLGLLSRQGKLAAVKVARDWLTTRRAVLWYVKTQKQKTESSLKSLKLAEKRLETAYPIKYE